MSRQEWSDRGTEGWFTRQLLHVIFVTLLGLAIVGLGVTVYPLARALFR